jgi:hypothetical protein
MNTRMIVSALALALTTAVAVPAFAHGDDVSFPAPAAAFQQHVVAKIARSRDHMEKAIVEHKIAADKAAEMRAKFEAGVAAVSAETAKVVADGTVTADEAKGVREIARQLHAGRGGHHCGGDDKKS